jgi:hypothetical protein
MPGDNRIRHCTLCDLNVYNFSEMTEREIREMIAQREGRRVCGRIFRRADGTILSRDCPRGIRAAAQRVSLWMSAALSALLAVGCASAPTPLKQGTIKLKPQAPKATPVSSGLIQIQANKIETGIVVTVIGLDSFVVAQASVTATPKSMGDGIVAGTTDEHGQVLLPLHAGNYQVTAKHLGFEPVIMVIGVPQGKLTPIVIDLAQRALIGDVVLGVPNGRDNHLNKN